MGSRSCFLSKAAANSGSASAALRVFSSRDSAASKVEIEDSSASATVDSPDDAVAVGDDDTVDDNAGDGDSAGSNVNGGEIDSYLTTTHVAADSVRTAGREDRGPCETVLPWQW